MPRRSHRRRSQRRGRDQTTTAETAVVDDGEGGKGKGKRPRKCIVCGLAHEPRCTIPPGWRKEQKAKQKAEYKALKNKGKGKTEAAA